jgi:hypothetical protein
MDEVIWFEEGPVKGISITYSIDWRGTIIYNVK